MYKHRVQRFSAVQNDVLKHSSNDHCIILIAEFMEVMTG